MIIWLASYPKSGNTWLRSMLTSLMYTEDGKFDFKYLRKIEQFPGHQHFRKFIKDPNDIHEIKKNWIVAQDKINLDSKIKFFKTHQGNFVINQYPFTNHNNTLATIYVVRDPRNLISSISNHYKLTIDESLNFISSTKFLKGSFENDGKTFKHVKVLLGNWAEHYHSWTKKNDNLLLIKYEDLINNTYTELNKIILFLKKYLEIKTNKIKNDNILKSTSFENLKKMEIEGKFEENVYDKKNDKVTFFHLGKKNQWQNNLDKEISDKVEKKFSKEMRELGYL